MEKYKKVVKDVKPIGELDQHGNQAFIITFSDDSSGFFRCKNQDLFQVGVESEYYVSLEKGKSGKVYSKIQRVSAIENTFEKKTSTGGSGAGVNKETSEMINRSVAIKAASELFSGQKIDREYVIETAEMFFDFIQFGVGKEEPKKELVITDELPF